MAQSRTPPIYTTPGDAATAFYQAIEARDIDTMMGTWAEDEDIVCVHPSGVRLVGYAAVRAGWEQLFAGDTRLKFQLDHVIAIETVGLAMQSAVEHVFAAPDGRERGIANCTNIFMRTPLGWRIVMHHASPAATKSPAETRGALH